MTEIFVIIFGLIAGSFLNVLIHRLPREESIVKPGSHCPKCKHPIAWFDNLPVLSFLLLGGRCRHCRERISWRYPLVELASGLAWYGSWLMSPGKLFFGASVVFFSLLLVAAFADLETQTIPDEVTLGGMVAGVGVSFFSPALHPLQSILGLLVGGGLVYVTGAVGNVLFKKELKQRGLDQSMGGGDVKLLAMAGSFLGWQKVLLTFFLAPFLGLPFALFQRLVKKEAVIPYGPFLALAAAIQFLFGEKLWDYFIGV